MSEQLPELVVLDRVEALLAWIHTQVRDGATMVRIGAVTEILAGNEPTTEPVGATYAIVPVARLSHLCAIEVAAEESLDGRAYSHNELARILRVGA